MQNIGTFLALAGVVLSVSVILFVVSYWFECLYDMWVSRWEIIQKRLIRRMIFRNKYRKDGSIRELNQDINCIHYIFQKYNLEDSFDKEERKYVRYVKKTHKF